MILLRYYRLLDLINESNVLDVSEPLVVNCAGRENKEELFHLNRPQGRKDNTLIYMIEGMMTYNRNDGSVATLKPGMGIFLRHDKIQNYYGSFSFYWIHFTGECCDSLLDKFGFGHEFIFDIGENEKVIRRFHKIFDEMMLRKKDFVYYSSLYLQEIFVEIKRSISSSGLSKRNLHKSFSYIHNNFSKDISIEELARMENLSVSQYRKLFLKTVDISPKKYIASLRISYAVNLLQYSDEAIPDIAAQSGYPDLCYFYRTFKQLTNMTPAECRKAKNIM